MSIHLNDAWLSAKEGAGNTGGLGAVAGLDFDEVGIFAGLRYALTLLLCGFDSRYVSSSLFLLEFPQT